MKNIFLILLTIFVFSANATVTTDADVTGVSSGGAAGFVTGSTDNAVLRADGTGGVTSQSSSVTIGDTGLIFGPVGAVGAPTYSFTTDTNTGMFLLASDTLAFAIGGASKLVLAGTDFNIAASTTSNYLSGTSVLKFWNTAGTFGATLRGNASQTGNTTFQLPISNGTSGNVLSTDGAGVTSWVPPAKPASVTADPCADTTQFAEGVIFWNDTSNYHCTCVATVDLKTTDYATACF